MFPTEPTSDEDPEYKPLEKVFTQHISVKLIDSVKCRNVFETIMDRPYQLGIICAVSLDGHFEGVNIFILSFTVGFINISCSFLHFKLKGYVKTKKWFFILA